MMNIKSIVVCEDESNDTICIICHLELEFYSKFQLYTIDDLRFISFNVIVIAYTFCLFERMNDDIFYSEIDYIYFSFDKRKIFACETHACMMMI